LLAAGEEKIFEFARVFRDRERGDLHLPEFCMLEWYRAGEPYEAVMADSIVSSPTPRRPPGSGDFRFAARPPIRSRSPSC
jgi:lysyl-tRNA synthetase class 2